MMDGIDIEEARRRYPLPDGVEDVVVNRSKLAEALDTSENTLTKWLARGMPCLQEGGNGRDYAFQLSDCWAWRMATRDAERAERARVDAAVAQLALQFANEGGAEAEQAAQMSPRDIKEQSEAHIVRMRAAEMRGELMRTAQVRVTIERMLDRLRRNMITLPDYCEREFGLKPDEVQRLERRAFAVLVDMRRDLEDLLAGGEVVGLGTGVDPDSDEAAG